MQKPQANRPWLWVPSLYFAQAIPYVVVMNLTVIMYKDMGISNSDIAFYTSLLYLPWVVKPLWSPIVDMFGTKRRWTVREAAEFVGLGGRGPVLVGSASEVADQSKPMISSTPCPETPFRKANAGESVIVRYMM